MQSPISRASTQVHRTVVLVLHTGLLILLSHTSPSPPTLAERWLWVRSPVSSQPATAAVCSSPALAQTRGVLSPTPFTFCVEPRSRSPQTITDVGAAATETLGVSPRRWGEGTGATGDGRGASGLVRRRADPSQVQCCPVTVGNVCKCQYCGVDLLAFDQRIGGWRVLPFIVYAHPHAQQHGQAVLPG